MVAHLLYKNEKERKETETETENKSDRTGHDTRIIDRDRDDKEEQA